MSDHKQQVQKAYVAATKRLRHAHQDEFHQLLQREYDAMGITVRKRLTGERKRVADMEKLRAKLAELEAQK